MGQNLTGQTIASTYEDLVQISGSSRNILTDGTGSDITSLAVTASHAVSSSYAVTASYAANAPTVNTSSLMVTGSVSSNTLTFTKGDGSTFNLTVDTGSAVSVNTGSLMVTGSATNNVLTFTKGDGSTFNLTVDTGSAVPVDTGSFYVSSSVNNATITFTQGDGTTEAVTVNNVSNASTASIATTAQTSSYATNFTVAGTLTAASASITYLETIYETASVIYSSGSNQFGDASNDVQTMYGTVDLKNGPLRVSGSTILSGSTDIQGGDFKVTDQTRNGEFDVDYFKVKTVSGAQFTGSVSSTGGFTGSLAGTASFAVTASYALNVPTVNTSSLLVTASITDATTTYTKGDGSTFTLTVNNVQNATSASYAASASYVNLGTSAVAGFTGSTWTFNHNLNNDFVVIDCYDSNNEEIIPQTIDLITSNQASIIFPTSVQGTAVASLGNGIVQASVTNNTYVNSSPVNTLSTQVGNFQTTYTQKLSITSTGTYNLHVSQSGPHWVDFTGLASGTTANLNIYFWVDNLATLPANSGSTVLFTAGAGTGNFVTYRGLVTGSGSWIGTGTVIGASSTSVSRNATLATRTIQNNANNPTLAVKTVDGEVVIYNPGTPFFNPSFAYTGSQGTPIP